MEKDRIPKPGQLYNHFKNKPYQIITVASHADTREEMVVYQALYGDFKCYIRPLDSFLSEVDRQKYPDVKQKYRFELRTPKELEDKQPEPCITDAVQEQSRQSSEMDISYDNIVYEALKDSEIPTSLQAEVTTVNNESVNSVLLQFLDAESYYKKLEVITSNRKHMSDRLINDMAVSLDCAVDEGPLDQRIQGLIYCLQAMCRFEDKRLR
ncbi:MAG: hypothetical protein K0R34_2290 [Herbinix sp.]|jgi:hypothetical protein|nr:hypothetical protein [Herbinix sp.]